MEINHHNSQQLLIVTEAAHMSLHLAKILLDKYGDKAGEKKRGHNISLKILTSHKC